MQPPLQVGFAGVYKGPADWEGGAQSEEPAAGRGGGRGLGRGSDAGGEGATEGATAASVAAAAFQPGQAVAVTSGNFRDFEGRVVAAEGGKVTAELDIFVSRRRTRDWLLSSAALLADGVLAPPCAQQAVPAPGPAQVADRRVSSTSSCPCPPSSAQGKRTRVDLSPADLAPAGGDGSSD